MNHVSKFDPGQQRKRYDARYTERMVPNTKKWQTSWAEHITRYTFAATHLQGCRVLDLGCGIGYGTRYLAEHGASEVVGVDYSQEAITQAQSEFHHPRASFVQDDAQQLDQIYGPFDGIVAYEIFEHVDSPTSMLARCRDLLSVGGWFYCSTPNTRFRPKLKDGITPRNPFHVKEYLEEEFREMLCKYFDSVEIFGQDYTPAYKRQVQALSRLQSCDFALWSNPLVRLGRLIQRLKGVRVNWMEDSCVYPPLEEDIVICEGTRGIEDATTFIARCRKQS
ncbi:MAG TPA: class I SAM-dependent methyltransferase [Pirellulales bacterium]|nr:class I SAM-dependent methyltransferase [Pirellulales bacterium]